LGKKVPFWFSDEKPKVRRGNIEEADWRLEGKRGEAKRGTTGEAREGDKELTKK